jgi:hypothetical protein
VLFNAGFGCIDITFVVVNFLMNFGFLGVVFACLSYKLTLLAEKKTGGY